MIILDTFTELDAGLTQIIVYIKWRRSSMDEAFHDVSLCLDFLILSIKTVTSRISARVRHYSLRRFVTYAEFCKKNRFNFVYQN